MPPTARLGHRKSSRTTSHLNVKVGEQSQEHERVEAHGIGDDLGEVAAVEQHLDAVEEDGDELNHLHGGQVLLPPQVFLVSRSHGSQQVVCVHDDVHKRVERAEEGGVAAGGESHTPPNRRRHNAVVDYVQVGDLVELLAQHKEDGVGEFGELAEVVPPAQVHHHQLVRVVRVIDRLARQTVAIQPPVHHHLG